MITTPEGGTVGVGRIVHYQVDERGGLRYILPAVITCTAETHPGNWTDAAGNIVENVVPLLSLEATTVHLHVLTPGPAGSYTEHAVPYDNSANPVPRSWHWPNR